MFQFFFSRILTTTYLASTRYSHMIEFDPALDEVNRDAVIHED